MGQETRRLLDEYEVSDVLGRGGFSVVRRGTRKSSTGGNPVAIKTLKRCGQTNLPGLPRNRGSEKRVASMAFPTWKQVSISDALLTNEILVMRKIVEHVSPHPNVINLHDVYEDPSGVHLVLELCSGGELFDRIVAQARYSEAGAAAVVKQLAEGLKALHQANIIHRDLKPENCLFLDKSEDATLKIMDFGLSSVEEFTDPVVGLFGSIDYVSPEVLSQGKISSSSDMWSLGVILYILLSGYVTNISQSYNLSNCIYLIRKLQENLESSIANSMIVLMTHLLTCHLILSPSANPNYLILISTIFITGIHLSSHSQIGRNSK